MTTIDTVVSALAVSGLDPSGGAGLLADVQTFGRFGVRAVGVATTLTVQNTTGVASMHPVDARVIGEQLDSVLSDVTLGAAKVGALGSASIVEVVGNAMAKSAVPWVVDPVVRASSGANLLDRDAWEAFRTSIVPRAALLTPNASEAGWLADRAAPRTREDAVACAEAIVAAGARAVLVTGGHLEEADRAVDVLVTGEETIAFEPGGRLEQEVHGTGCALSAAIAAQLALGTPLTVAIRTAKRWLFAACATAVRVGSGSAAVNLHQTLDPER